MLTAIVPIDLQRRPRDIIQKALLLASAAEEKNIKVVFGYNNRSTRYDSLFLKRINKFRNIDISQSPEIIENINSSALRNLAFLKVTTENIILLDVDIYPDFDLFYNCAKEINSLSKPFIILPCLYLTATGSKQLLREKITTKVMCDKYFSFSRKEFLHLASPSSIVTMKRADYEKINGFDESFNGHGYEDFDFLVRLASYHKMINLESDFLTDLPHRSPLFAVGFRKTLGEVCLDSLIKKQIAFHLHHKKDNDENYYQSRKSNFNKFQELHSGNLSKLSHEKSLLEIFISACREKNISYHDYSILFENKPGHIDRHDTFKRRLKFIFNI